MDETGGKKSLVEVVKENQESVASPAGSPSSKPKNVAHSERSPKSKGEKLHERITKPKQVWRRESLESRPRSGPMIARHNISQSSNLRLDTAIARSTHTKSSLRPTSPSYESAFKRQVVNRPVSPGVGYSGRRVTPTSSFNKGRRPPSPNIAANPEEVLRRRTEKAKKAKLYLLQQAGPNTFIIAGGESEEHRHKVTVGPQTCTCGRALHCVHILFVMVRVFQLTEHDHLTYAKVLKNFEVETLFKKYETRRKMRLTRAHAASLSTSSSADSEHAAAGDSASHESSDVSSKMEVTCPICLLDLLPQQPVVHCEHCHNRLHNDCMAIWYQLVRRQGDQLTCPLCRALWTAANSRSFENVGAGEARPESTTETHNASPNSLGVSPVSGFTEIEPTTLLPRCQPIPQEHADITRPWVEVFGEDLIGCLFMKNEWVMRETALRHLSREIIMLLSHPSDQDITSSPTNPVSEANSGESQSARPPQQSCYQSRIENVLELSCQILAMMMTDPVYKVYVSSLRSLRTMLSYCTLPDVTKLREYMRPVIQSIVLKCADGNRKTNQLSISTLCEFAKDQDGELAIGRELGLQNQNGLGGCMYVLECCTLPKDVDNSQIQWLNGRLLTMNQLLEKYPGKFAMSEIGEQTFSLPPQHILLPMIEFAIMAVAKAGSQPRTMRYAKKVIMHCSKYLSTVPGMNTKIRALLSQVEPELRGRFERWVIEMSVTAHQAAINSNQSACRDQSPDMAHPRVGSQPEEALSLSRGKKSLAFGSLYHAAAAAAPKEKLAKLNSVDLPPPSRLPRPLHSAVYHRRSDSYTEAVYAKPPEQVHSQLANAATAAPYYEPPGASPTRLRRQSSESIESVEGDCEPLEPDYHSSLSGNISGGRSSSPDTDMIHNGGAESADVMDTLLHQEAAVGDEADLTLTALEGSLLPSDGEYDGFDHPDPPKSPVKLSRGSTLTSSKPCVHRRSSTEPDHEQLDEFDGGRLVSHVSTDLTIDTIDGAIPSRSPVVPPMLQSNESMGFDMARAELIGVYDDFDIQPLDHATDSESCTDHISRSVSLSLSSNTTDDECEEFSDNDYVMPRTHNKSVPFGGYRPGKHVRSRTDPSRLHRDKSSQKSPRYHSDPAGAESTTSSSSASTPRTPPVSSSESKPLDETGTVQAVRPLSRALTFSDPPFKRQLPPRPQSMRTSRGSNSLRSRLPSRSKTASIVSPIAADPPTSFSILAAGVALSAPPAASAGADATKSKRSSSPIIPAVIRALTPPHSPLRSQSIMSSTPLHTPPSSPPKNERDSPISSPSPPGVPVTAIVRPQATLVAVQPMETETPLTEALPPVVTVSNVEPSVPIQRQTSATAIGNLIALSTSSSSDDHKPSSDSMCVGDLSDSTMASPYEKPVSFKSEVALFSPRGSLEGDSCPCKDEVELEEAIALARAMEISTHQTALPEVPGLSVRHMEETITIHVQPDQTDGTGGQVEYLQGTHWKRGMMIGTGAFSTCYQCRDVKTGTIMAVKQISFCRNSESEQDSICSSVIDEIRMMATLNHSNIVRILGATQTGAHFNMFVEWMPGGSVSHLLEKYGAFSEPVITSYTHQVLMGLAYLHDHQILHRDMKGANLLVDSTGKHLRIGDFGACAQLASSMTGAGELRGQLLGTIAFMAPEVLRGEHYGRACDVWSVGCVVIEMVTTKPPWNASNVSNHLKLIFTIASASASPPIPDNLPPGIKDLMLRCLEPESKHRPSAKELLQHPLFTRSHYRRR